uniref:Uncharacterized protein n=1 Tax=Schizaphis graminum TaxID=13262 RepID=A0A2S2NCQ4_SCHGA
MDGRIGAGTTKPKRFGPTTAVAPEHVCARARLYRVCVTRRPKRPAGSSADSECRSPRAARVPCIGMCAAGGASFNQDWPRRPTDRRTADRPTTDRPHQPPSLAHSSSSPCHLAARNVGVPDGVVGRNAHHHRRRHGEDAANHRLHHRPSNELLIKDVCVCVCVCVRV